MQYKVPRIPTFTGLEGIDLRVQQIQIKLASESWLQYSFGLCDRVLEQKGEEIESIPVCHIDDHSDPLDMRPFLDDAHNSYCFWDMVGETTDYGDNLGARRFPALTYDVACIFVVNLASINVDSKIARSTVRQDILTFFNQTIRFNGIFQMTNIEERDIELIFDGYDIYDPQLILRDSVGAFRIDGTITFKQDC